MTAEQRERAFEPFYSTKPRAFGLGLSVVRAVVEELQGAISVQSQLAAGTQVEVFLPADDPVEPGSPRDAGNAAPLAPGAVAPGAERRILVVDDEPSVLRMGGLLLSRLGYAPTLVASGREALEKLRDVPLAFDLVITDISMPGMTGLELVREVRAVHPELPILVTSGFLDDATRRQLAAFGVQGSLAKPFGRKELAAAIAAIDLTG
jgi:CheY-like chemotaxis protein